LSFQPLPATEAKPLAAADVDLQYVRLPRQITVPIWQDEAVHRIVAVEVTLAVVSGAEGDVLAMEPRLRAGLLASMVTIAHSGGFTATDTKSLDAIGKSLRRAADQVIPGKVREVLVTDIFVQEM